MMSNVSFVCWCMIADSRQFITIFWWCYRLLYYYGLIQWTMTIYVYSFLQELRVWTFNPLSSPIMTPNSVLHRLPSLSFPPPPPNPPTQLHRIFYTWNHACSWANAWWCIIQSMDLDSLHCRIYVDMRKRERKKFKSWKRWRKQFLDWYDN